MRLSVWLGIVLLCAACAQQPVLTGLDRVGEYAELFQGKRIGIVTNHTAYDSKGQHIADVFAAMPQVQVTALFGPEHGIRGDAEAGADIDSSKDITRKVPVFSLYGRTTKPTPEMLENVDVLVFDIQDVGARFYTYIWTMARCMEAAAENGKVFVVLDRPNPINGRDVQGNILEMEYATFVGLYPIPVRHGMTIGELAQMFNGEGWLAGGVKADVHVVSMQGWRRDMWFDQTGLQFRAPSPNIPDFATTVVYTGTCLFEGVNISEARGTLQPFMQFGAPWLESRRLADALNGLQLAGVRFKPIEFTPLDIPGKAMNPKYENQVCSGLRLEVTDRDVFYPYLSAIRMLMTIKSISGDSLTWRSNHFDRLCGAGEVRRIISTNGNIDSLRQSWQQGINQFILQRERYLLHQ
jgi:uncharacterized protein YbbC (DUF1343 family)